MTPISTTVCPRALALRPLLPVRSRGRVRRTSRGREHLLLPAACGSEFISLVGLRADGLLIEKLEPMRPLITLSEDNGRGLQMA